MEKKKKLYNDIKQKTGIIFEKLNKKGEVKPLDRKKVLKNLILFGVGGGLLIGSVLLIWITTIKIPDFSKFSERKVELSTKIYDRTGEVALYDVHNNIKRTIGNPDEIGANIKNATVAIEDSEFYQHKGVRLKAFMRAIWVNLTHGSLSQGGSTITQQLIKNTLLTQEKTITRKIKEWILAIKIEQVMGKNEILSLYLNENPYGGSIYGITEASKTFFNKSPADLTLAEAAYLAAIPKAPTFYSPYGKNKDKLEERKNLVLARMKELEFITPEQYQEARNEKITFLPQEITGIKAPHFVFFVKQYLEQKYGKDLVESGGLKVTTTLDYDLQKYAEEELLKHAKENEKDWNGSNAALVATDPKTGQVLSMVGSRDYFDKGIDGNFNVATAFRQPGSSFKPFIYATAFEKGYTPETAIFDVFTEFQTTCDPSGKPRAGHNASECYHPSNYDGNFRGPMSLRNALAQSINIPAVQMLYLVGIKDSIKTARDMGIKTLDDPDRYGLTLVIGGGEVSLLDMTTAYGTFANQGMYHPYQAILKVQDSKGNILEDHTVPDEGTPTIEKNASLLISDILSDNQARVPTFGANSPLVISGREVAVKTGTTNNNKDAWTMGYTPSIAVGVWVGNNDNKPMKKGGAALAGPIWHDYMAYALKNLPDEQFESPEPIDTTGKPIFHGLWQGGESFIIDAASGKLATEDTPPELRIEKVVTNVHSILYWVDKNDPTGPPPSNPEKDPQYNHWETAVQNWWSKNKSKYGVVSVNDKPSSYDDVHTENNSPKVSILSPNHGSIFTENDRINVEISASGPYQITKADFFVNNEYIGSSTNSPFSTTFSPSEIGNIQANNVLKVVVYDLMKNAGETTTEFIINQ